MKCMFVFTDRWKDNTCMPNGLVYEGVQTEPMAYSGGSAAQSSLLHCFDELLGVKHKEQSGEMTDLFSLIDILFGKCHKGVRRTFANSALI